MNVTTLSRSVFASAIAGLLAVLLLLTSYFVLEPVVSRAQATEVFTVQQTITAEISFVASTSVNNMAPNLSGVTGGYSTGTAQAAVLTNNQTGYNMTIRFGTSTLHTIDKMLGDTNGGAIGDYDIGATSTPNLIFAANNAGESSQFAFTVNASNTADIHSNFLDNGTNCGIEDTGSYTANRCWMSPTSTAYLVIDRSTATPSGSGSTSTVQFKVAVPSNPNPALPNDTYTATVTLTATVNG